MDSWMQHDIKAPSTMMTAHSLAMFRARLPASLILVAIVAGAAGKPPPPAGAPWAKYAGKPVYARSMMGPPPMSPMGTISVPYIPKSPFFPKFVDPRMMIAKKTDMLSNMFGGIGPEALDLPTPSVYSQSALPDNSYVIAGEFAEAAEPEDETKASSGATTSIVTRGLFGPVGPGGAFPGPFGPSFGPPFGSPFASPFTPPFGKSSPSADADSYAYSRRALPGATGTLAPVNPASTSSGKSALFSTLVNSVEPTLPQKGAGTAGQGPPPAWPTGLGPVPEEPEPEPAGDTRTPLEKMFGSGPMQPSATGPKEYLPGMFGPMGPMVDPGAFIAKKTTFLDTLFKTIATSTAAPAISDPDASTDLPPPKSTIVPPDFWLPTTVTAGPGIYDDKVNVFLGKLFDSLKPNLTDGSVAVPSVSESEVTLVARSAGDPAIISAAKAQIVDSILTELSDLKGSMVATLNDLVTYEKAAALPPPTVGGKPFKPKPFAPGFWPKPPTADATLPYEQRMAILSQVFDMLTDLQRNLTAAVQDSSESTAPIDDAPPAPMAVDAAPTAGNFSLLDAIKAKLIADAAAGKSMSVVKGGSTGSKMSRSLPGGPGSFWVAAPVEDNPKRSVQPVEGDAGKIARGVKMQLHQGSQSLPAGAIESVQAGGGSVTGHQGGGIKLLETEDSDDFAKWMEWKERFKNYERQQHHHH